MAQTSSSAMIYLHGGQQLEDYQLSVVVCVLNSCIV